MLITLRPGVDPITTRNALDEIGTKAGNLSSGTGSPGSDANTWLVKYLGWATDAVARLRYAVADADIDRLVLTPRYYALLSRAGSAHGTSEAPLFNGLVSLELAERIAAFETAVKTLDDHLDRWTTHRKSFVVADSSFYLNSPDPLGRTDLHQVLGRPAGDDIHLLFPIVVVDELDKLKETGRTHARWRAGHTLGLLDEAVNGGITGILPRRRGASASEPAGWGDITVEIVLDQPGHIRLPIDDDEIIDRAAAIKAIAHCEVRLLTCDTGQATRGRLAGLEVVKLPSTAGEGAEPPRDRQGGDQPRGAGGRGQRKNRRDAEAAEGQDEA